MSGPDPTHAGRIRSSPTQIAEGGATAAGGSPRTAVRRRWPVVLGAAAHPLTGGRLATLRAAELRLLPLHPRPTVVAVLGMSPRLGTSRLTALLAQALHGVATSRVAVLDCDGVGQPQRRLLDADEDGDVTQMLSARSTWRIRRAVERFAASDALVPLYCAASGTATALSAEEVVAAVRLIRRRHPVVVLDVPAGLGGGVPMHAVQAADHVLAVIPAGTSPAAVETWVQEIHPGVGLTVVAPRGPHPDGDVDVVTPELSAQVPTAARLAAAPLNLQASIGDIAVRVTAAWRVSVSPAAHLTHDVERVPVTNP